MAKKGLSLGVWEDLQKTWFSQCRRKSLQTSSPPPCVINLEPPSHLHSHPNAVALPTTRSISAGTQQKSRAAGLPPKGEHRPPVSPDVPRRSLPHCFSPATAATNFMIPSTCAIQSGRPFFHQLFSIIHKAALATAGLVAGKFVSGTDGLEEWDGFF
ncbi:hypothetical protein CEXT_690441 [Caerostris extrusa]|uniref:Uncharacterized protein n=1 Tax=Caerostris extrusa TaxID=172846 RepID=A0AAV4MNQ3_CAEEX|nr:hypothetical protein CEXT_690441 [Caerostris extrusa]